jgi:hypothetical protein
MSETLKRHTKNYINFYSEKHNKTINQLISIENALLELDSKIIILKNILNYKNNVCDNCKKIVLNELNKLFEEIKTIENKKIL